MSVQWQQYGIDPKVMARKPKGISTRQWALQNASEAFRAAYYNVGAPRNHGNDKFVKSFLWDTNILRTFLEKLKPKAKPKGSIWSRYLAWPLPTKYKALSQNFYVTYPYTQFFIDRGLAGKKHGGLDIPVPSGTPVYSPGSGKVIHAGPYGGYGNTVIIQVGKHWVLLAHNQNVKVKEGQRVRRGQIVAQADSSGFSTGSHLHYEVRVNGMQVDPQPITKFP